jgi:O-succinylbenzoic acid--CoA ligase
MTAASSTSYTIDGRSYSREALLEHCRRRSEDTGEPEWRQKLWAFIMDYLDSGSRDILQQSSGTTGDPKVFWLKKDAMRSSALRTLAYFGLKAGERALLCLPVDYIAGKMMVVRALEGGLDLECVAPVSTPLLEVDGSFSFAPMVPLQVRDSLASGEGLDRVRCLLVGGGEIPFGLQERLRKLQAPEVYESFGMSETYTHFALRRINGPQPEQAFRLLDGVRIRQDGQGCLVVEMEDVTEGEVHTRDQVEILEDGSVFRWLGRLDHVINSGGIKINPEVLEQEINRILGTNCLLLPEEDERLGQRMVMVAQWPGDEAPVEAWLAMLRARLQKHEVPKKIHVLPKLPRNASFKPDRRACLRLISGSY